MTNVDIQGDSEGKVSILGSGNIGQDERKKRGFIWICE